MSNAVLNWSPTLSCLATSSPSSARPPSCGCCRAAPTEWASASSPASSSCPRARCTGSCARCSAWASSSRTRSPASTSSARRCCTWARATSTATSCARALNWSDALAARSEESVRIGTLHENQVLVVHHVFRPDDSHQALEVGALLPAHASALGKALLAHHQYLAAELAGAGCGRARPRPSPTSTGCGASCRTCASAAGRSTARS